MAKQNIEIQQYVGGTSGYNNYYPNTGDNNVKLSTTNASVWGSTLEEALPKINNRLVSTESNQWEIGDIRVTTKNSLGNKWLKCDGSSYKTNSYPDLAKVTTQSEFPTGTGVLTSVSIPRSPQYFEPANGTWDNNQLAAKVNNHYIRTSAIAFSDQVCSFTVYYSKDFLNWSSFLVSFNVSSNSTDITAVSPKSVGYENGYWYFSFGANNTQKQCIFVYKNTLTEGNWALVSLDNSSRWDGKIFYYNGKWRTYSLRRNPDKDVLMVTKIESTSINFINPTYVYQGGDVNYSTSFFKSFYIGSTVYVIYTSTNSSQSRTSYYWWNASFEDDTEHNYGSFTTQYYTVNKIVAWDGGKAVYWTGGANTTNTYIGYVTGQILSSALSGSVITYPIDFVNGWLYYYRVSGTKATIYRSSTIWFDNSITLSTTLESNAISGSLVGKIVTDDAIYFADASTSANRLLTGKIEFGGILPNYTPTSLSKTKLNAFIKALD